MKKILFLNLVLLAVLLSARPKLVTLGKSPDPALLRTNIGLVEKSCPFDGITIELPRQIKNGKLDVSFGHEVFIPRPLDQVRMKKWVDDLKQVRFSRLKHNFTRVSVCGASNYGFFDDACWKIALDNVRTVARAAKAGGLKGIMFDVEHYDGKKPMLFQYVPGKGHSLEENRAKARERGRQFMNALAGEFPDIIVFTVLGSFSLNFDAVDSGAAPESAQYGLANDFFNGMLDVIPPKAKLLDGMETRSYYAQDAKDFYRLANEYTVKGLQLAAPENRRKFLEQTSAAPGVWLEPFLWDGYYVIKSPDMDRMALFRSNLYAAMETAREYAWVYFCSGLWFDMELPPVEERSIARYNPTSRLLPERYPGLLDTLDFVRDPLGYARQHPGELVCREDFEKGQLTGPTPISKKLLPGLEFNQKHGKGELVPGAGIKGSTAVRFTGVRNGIPFKALKVKPGEVYYIRLDGKAEGDTYLYLGIAYRNRKPQEMYVTRRRISFSGKSTDGYRTAELVTLVPDNASTLIIRLGCNSNSATGAAWFDDLEIRRIF